MLILSVFFMLVFGVSVAFSVNVTMFSTLRFFEGFCLAGLALSLYVLRKYLPAVFFCFLAAMFPRTRPELVSIISDHSDDVSKYLGPVIYPFINCHSTIFFHNFILLRS